MRSSPQPRTPSMTPVPRILIVDDDPEAIRVLYGALEGLGQFHFANRGKKALTLLAEYPFDLILLDIRMPGMDGFMTCRALRQDYPDLPVIFMTAVGDFTMEIQALEVGGNDFISKPINPPVVRARVTLHLKLQAQNAARRRAELKMRKMLDHMPTALAACTLDPDHRVTYLNDQFTHTFGYTLADMPTIAEWAIRAYPEERFRTVVLDWWHSTVAKAIPERGHVASQESQVTCKDGGVREVIISATVLEDMLLISFVDITAHRRAEAALRESEEKFRLAFYNANTGMCLVDLQGKIFKVNGKMSAIFGYSPRELERMTVNDLAFPEDRGLSPTFIREAAAKTRDSVTFEERYRHRQGHILYGQAASSLVRDARGQPRYFIYQVQDITARQQAEAAAEKARRAKSEFLAQMTHELRTPLHAILGFAEVLNQMENHTGAPPADWNGDRDRRRELLGAIQRNGRHLLALVNDVLDLSRMEHGYLALKVRPTDLHALLHDSVDDLAPLAQNKGLALVLELDAGLPAWIEVDSRRLIQVLNNLLGNAIKFTEQGEVRLQVGATPEPDDPGQVELRFTVTDTGPGIAAADQDRIFAAFVQAVPGASAPPGSGLGLAISRQLASLMGGAIRLDSAPGLGSRFTLTLPGVPRLDGQGCEPIPSSADAISQRLTGTPEPEFAASDPPPVEALRELRELAELGRTTRIEAWCRHWAAPDRQPAFAARVLQLALAFENDRIVALVDAGLAVSHNPGLTPDALSTGAFRP